MRDFCSECGCHWPPREGEGRCKDFQKCWIEQLQKYIGWQKALFQSIVNHAGDRDRSELIEIAKHGLK